MNKLTEKIRAAKSRMQKVLLALLMMIPCAAANVIPVNAASVTAQMLGIHYWLEWAHPPYFKMSSTDTSKWYYAFFNEFEKMWVTDSTIDSSYSSDGKGILAYCIDPTNANTPVNYTSSQTLANYTFPGIDGNTSRAATAKNNINKYVYFGYGYGTGYGANTNHNTDYYYIATQILVWDEDIYNATGNRTNDREYFTSSAWQSNIEAYRLDATRTAAIENAMTEIKNVAAKYDRVQSANQNNLHFRTGGFSGTTVTSVKAGSIVALTLDNDNANLSDFAIVSVTGGYRCNSATDSTANTSTTTSNGFYFCVTDPGTFTVRVRSRFPRGNATKSGSYGNFVYSGTGAQSGAGQNGVVRGSLNTASKEMTISLTVLPNDGYLKLTKTDSAGNDLAGLGAVFGIYDSTGTNLIQTIDYNESTKDNTYKLEVGSYILREITPPQGYYLAADIPITITDSHTAAVPLQVTASDNLIQVKIQKTDENGNLLAGASLQVLNSSDTAADTFDSHYSADEVIWSGISGTEAIDLTAQLEATGKTLCAGKTYILREIAAPDNYYIANDVPFTVSSYAQTSAGTQIAEVISMSDEPVLVQVGKTDAETGSYVAGADLRIEDSSGTIVWSGRSSASGPVYASATGGWIIGESYTLIEIAGPAGYYLNSSPGSAAQFTVSRNAPNSPVIVSAADYTIKARIAKFAADGSTFLTGFGMSLYDMDSGTIVWSDLSEDSWIDVSSRVAPGHTYILSETSAVDGYYLSASTASMTIPENASDAVAAAVRSASLTDTMTSVLIDKKDDDNNYVVGAKLGIYPENTVDFSESNALYTWTTDGTPKDFTGILRHSSAYIVHEIITPAGYLQAADETIVIPENDPGEIIRVTMTDPKMNIRVGKKDSESGDWIASAHLAVYDITYSETGTIVSGLEDIITTDSPTDISLYLLSGHSYRLVETQTPTGYFYGNGTSGSASVEFTMMANEDQTQTLAIEDRHFTVYVNKVDEEGTPVIGAKMQILDENHQPIVVNDNDGTEWITDGTAREVSAYLEAGRTYYLHEAEQPNGYVLNTEDIKFTIDREYRSSQEDSNGVINLQMSDQRTFAEISKTNVTGQEEISGAVLQILDENMNPVMITFTDPETDQEITADQWTTAAAKPVTVIGQLLAGRTYYLHEISVPYGYKLADDVPFEIDPISGKAVLLEDPVCPDGYSYEYTVEPGTVLMIDDYDLGHLTVQKVNEDNEPLEGITFEIYTKDENDQYHPVFFRTDSDNNIIAVINQDAPGEGEQQYILETDENGQATFKGLLLMTDYYLKETKTLRGYMLMKDYIGPCRAHPNTDPDEVIVTLTAENSEVINILMTGGRGVMEYALVGVGFMAIAAALFLEKKKRQ